MSEFKKLYDHLRECVDSDQFTAITEDGVEFNTFDWAFGLVVNARKEHEQLNKELEQLRKELKYARELLKSCQGYIQDVPVLRAGVNEEAAKILKE